MAAAMGLVVGSPFCALAAKRVILPGPRLPFRRCRDGRCHLRLRRFSLLHVFKTKQHCSS
uniref:Uncharacterized protein n=1 Tax=Oryza glumipatula TaxID=40148 RepID=A0A0D9YK63_9ORYZ